jgi:UDP-glucose 6-dehydrogenase
MVQTPNGGGDKFYDHTILSNVLTQINSYKPKDKHIVIGCTVMPKYTNSVARLLLCNCENTTISYNPEFIAQGDIVNGLIHPDMIVVCRALNLALKGPQ